MTNNPTHRQVTQKHKTNKNNHHTQPNTNKPKTRNDTWCQPVSTSPHLAAEHAAIFRPLSEEACLVVSIATPAVPAARRIGPATDELVERRARTLVWHSEQAALATSKHVLSFVCVALVVPTLLSNAHTNVESSVVAQRVASALLLCRKEGVG